MRARRLCASGGTWGAHHTWGATIMAISYLVFPQLKLSLECHDRLITSVANRCEAITPTQCCCTATGPVLPGGSPRCPLYAELQDVQVTVITTLPATQCLLLAILIVKHTAHSPPAALPTSHANERVFQFTSELFEKGRNTCLPGR